MDKQTFQVRIAQAGYSHEEAAQIEIILRHAASIPVSQSEIRDAAFYYLVVCREIEKLLAFLRTVDNLSRGYAIGWTNASAIAVRIVAMWWRP
jgi:hypothetical protein